LKSLRESGDAIRAFEAALFGASTDAPEKNARFAESLELDYPILSDPDGKVAAAYGVRLPLIGVASRWTFYIGTDGRILDIDKKVTAGSHGAAVAQRLEALGVPRKGA
jgi:peroxiredoxin Q/BCP